LSFLSSIKMEKKKSVFGEQVQESQTQHNNNG
jgi:hypothetical protein